MVPSPLDHKACLSPFKRDSGFSLIELLSVVALLVILMGATLPSLLSSNRSSALTQGGNQLVDLSTYARQTALSKNVITALIIVDQSTASEKQAVTVVEYDPLTKSWKQKNAWLRLPDEIKATDATPDQTAVTTVAPADFKIGGNSLTAYSALVFYPDGRMGNPDPNIRQVKLEFATGSSNNFYSLVFNSDTSAFRVLRPK